MNASVACATADAAGSTGGTLDALQDQLRSLEDLLIDMAGDERGAYTARPSRMSGSVSEHVRHILDHVNAFVVSAGSDSLTYDSRLRGTPVEFDVDAALREVAHLASAIDRLDRGLLGMPVMLMTVTRRNTPAGVCLTTWDREAAFVVHHTVHHCALVAVLLERLGVRVPAGFGYAPSTPVPEGN